jgi:LysM repeat protein
LTKKKGSLRDPLFHLGLISVILFGIMSLGAGFIFKKDFKQENFSLLASVSEVLDRSGSQPVFAAQKAGANPLDLSLSQRNSLRGISTPSTVSFQTLGSLVGEPANSTAVQSDSKAIVEYLVEENDTISSMAEKFGISVETILWANELTKSSVLKPGQKLIILPVSGVLYYVKLGDTLSDIAETYKADINDILTFNELSSEGDIYVGDILIIPNGVKPKPVAAVSYQIPLASSYFICPIASPCRITQGLHFSNAVDFSNGVCGSPIYAAASGQVLRIKYGYNNGAGNYITIQHPNGVTTMYGHLQSMAVNQGDTVSQGQVIAYMGGQPGMPGAGRSTGCHVHLQVQGAKNPFAR